MYKVKKNKKNKRKNVKKKNSDSILRERYRDTFFYAHVRFVDIGRVFARRQFPRAVRRSFSATSNS